MESALEKHRKNWQGKSDEWLFERLNNELKSKVEEIHRLLYIIDKLSPPSQSEVKDFYCRQKAIGRRDDTCSEQCDNCKLKN